MQHRDRQIRENGKIMEIDECELVSSKYHKGRSLKNQGKFIFDELKENQEIVF